MKGRLFLRHVMSEMSGEDGDVVVVNDSNGYAYDVCQVSKEGEALSVVIHPEDWIGVEHVKKSLYAVILLAEERDEITDMITSEKLLRAFGPVIKPEAEQIENVVQGIIEAHRPATSIGAEIYKSMRTRIVELEVIGWMDDDTISNAMAAAVKELEYDK